MQPILVFLFSISALALDRHLTTLWPSAIFVSGVDLRTWPSSLSAGQAFDILRAMVGADLETEQIFIQAQQKLAEHRISDIHSIISYCVERESIGEDFISQNAEIVAARIAISGVKSKDWPASAIQAVNNAFSSKIVKTPFIEYLLIAENPSLCLKKTDNLLFSYNALVHELVHFLRKDPFKEIEDAINTKDAPDLLQSMVFQRGGELDAYQVGVSAEIKFLKRNQIRLRSIFHSYFDDSGKLQDAKAFKESVVKLYSAEYQNPKQKSKYLKSRLQFIDWQMQVLQNSVRPMVLASQRSELQGQLQNELSRLSHQKSLLVPQIQK